MDAEIIKRITRLEQEVERLKSFEFAKVIFLNQSQNVLNDSTVRTAPYVNNAIQVTGVGTLPAQIRGIFYNLYVTPSGGTTPALTVENPSFVAGVINYQSQNGGTSGTNGGFVSLDSNGRLRINLQGGATSLIRIDVWGYVL